MYGAFGCNQELSSREIHCLFTINHSWIFTFFNLILFLQSFQRRKKRNKNERERKRKENLKKWKKKNTGINQQRGKKERNKV